MSEGNAWRMECCQQMLVTLAQEPKVQVVITLIPIRRKGLGGHVLSVVAFSPNGQVRASCRHEVDGSNFTQWYGYISSVAGAVLVV